jgi:DNA helicase-2/ATP-dependent DNA helicase PcrA
LGVWIRARMGGQSQRLTYGELLIGGSDTHLLLHELYEDGADIHCMCRVNQPVSMHIRRLRMKPPIYCLVTNRHQEHDPSCPRFHDPSFRIPEQIKENTPKRHQRPKPERRVQVSRESRSDRRIEAEDDELQRGTFFVPSLDELNDAQREAATHKDGPCIVVAAAGSGKTAMLIARIKYLLDSGVSASRILACTFTRKAATEMKERLVIAVGDVAKQVTIGTMHSIAYKMLAQDLENEWTIVPEPSWLIEQVLEPYSPYNPHGVGPLMKVPDAITAVYKAKADGLWPHQVPEPLTQVYSAFEALKASKKNMDFEDLILMAIEHFRDDEQFRARWQDKWQYVLVDEYQDTNTAQWLFLRELVRNTRNLFVVGDDAQAIYSWRGSRPDLMLNFPKEFPDAKVQKLTINYRSHDLIVDLGNRVIDLNREHQMEKQVVAARAIGDAAIAQVVTVNTDIEEAQFVANEIAELRNRNPSVRYSEYVVLFRTNIQSRIYEEALAEKEIPYHMIGATHFYESPSVKVILDYLRTSLYQTDSSLWTPLLNRPKRFIPKVVVQEVSEGGWDALERQQKCRAFVQTIRRLQDIQAPAEAIRWLVLSLDGLVKPQEEDEPIKWVESLMSSAKRYSTVSDFLRFVDWVIERSQEPKEDAVGLSTIHRSKGLEWNTVFVAGLAEGLLPHKKNLVGDGLLEETRLCYVAITRAKENLYLLSSAVYGETALDTSRYIRVLQEG